ncbi:MAG: class I SAM-dependent methyltransferase [bacterium]|nr:class I SAM-dependent methyltransferase [bacterium]
MSKKYWKNKWSSKNAKPANSFAKRAYILIRKKKLKTVLDLGSGDGRDAIYFARKGLTVFAFDFSRGGIQKLKKDSPEVKAILGDIKKLPFKKNSFDVIYAHLSLHYFTDAETRRIFNRLHEILKKGGLLFVKCKSTDDALFGKGAKLAENVYRRGHLRHFFSREYTLQQLRKFKVLRIAKTSSVYFRYKSSYIEAIATK